MEYLIITDHADARTRERLGLPRRAATKNAARALSRGLVRDDVAGSMRRYLDEMYQIHQTCNNIRVYCGNVYVFYYGTMITVFPLPHRFRRLATRLQQEKRRSANGEIDPTKGDPCQVH